MLSDLAPIFSNILIGAVAILLVVLFWRSTRGSKAGDTAVMRLALLLLLAPFVAAAVIATASSNRDSAAAGR